MSGWIKLHRKMLDWEWYTDVNTNHLFMHCILKANHQDKKWRGIEIKRGSFITSLDSLSKETGLSVMQIRTSLQKLINTQNVTSKSSSKNRLISIANFDSYQDDNKLVTSEQQTDNKQVTTTKNDKKEKNDKNLVKEGAPPFEKIIDLWNEKIQMVLKPNSRGVTLTPTRKIKLSKRFKEDFHDSLEEWNLYLEQIMKSDFLTGINDRHWTIDIDFALKPDNLTRIVEGRYESNIPKEKTREERLAIINQSISKVRQEKIIEHQQEEGDSQCELINL